MRVTARTDYALRAVIELAAADDRLVSAVEIAQAQQIPKQFLDAILRDLRRGGIIASHRGSAGGFRLAREAASISLADVIRAVDGPLATVRGEAAQNVSYEGSASALQLVWIAVRSELRGLLENITVQDVANADLPQQVTTLSDDPSAWTSR